MELMHSTETFAIRVEYRECFHQIEILFASQVHPSGFEFSRLRDHVH